MTTEVASAEKGNTMRGLFDDAREAYNRESQRVRGTGQYLHVPSTPTPEPVSHYPPDMPPEVAAQLAEDEIIFGNAFYSTTCPGGYARIDPRTVRCVHRAEPKTRGASPVAGAGRMDQLFSVFNLHVNDAGHRADAEFVQQFGQKAFDEYIKPIREGVMAIFDTPATVHTSAWVALVTAFANELRDPVAGSRERLA